MNVKTTMQCCNSETPQTDEKLMECQTERVEESHPTDESESRHVVSGFPQACSSSHSKQRNSIRYPNNNGEKLRIPDSNGTTVQLRSQNSEVTQQKECGKTSLHIFNEATRLHASESRTSQLPVREEQATQLHTIDIRTPQLSGRRIRIPQMQESTELTTDKNTDSVPLISEISVSGRPEGYANEVEGYANEVEEYANEVAEPQNYLNDSKTLLPRSCRSKQLQKNINKMKRMHSNKLELGNETNCARRFRTSHCSWIAQLKHIRPIEKVS
ncbi:uncharacterized protein [Ptychodera flava]|uniref:uncharacterized protein n=1 Tax=Ptychodera flava TaxID=63121 RepID=UPI00396A3206